MTRIRIFSILCALLATLIATQPVTASAATTKIAGVVTLQGKPMAGATVTAMLGGDHPGAATSAGTAKTSDKGRFSIDIANVTPGSVFVVQAAGGDLGKNLTLAVALNDSWSPTVKINELTTIASAYGLAQFMHNGKAGGSGIGIINAVAISRQLISPATGRPTPLLLKAPNGIKTQTLPSLNSLANLLVACHTDIKVCKALQALTKGVSTVQSISNLAKDPSFHAKAIFLLTKKASAHKPALKKPINAWLMALKFVGNGQQFGAPGNFIFDAEGNLWLTNNYVPTTDVTKVCGGKALLKLEPFVNGAPVTEYKQGGVDGAGFGITTDHNGNIWLSNYGFKGSKCTEVPPSNSLSVFTPIGTAVSPVEGYTSGALSWPQGMDTSRTGTINVASCGNDKIVRYPDADINNPVALTGNGLNRPFGLVVDADGNTWATNVAGNSVSAFNAAGEPLTGSPFSGGGIRRPLGIAVDTLGNKWIANSQKIMLPCGHGTTPNVDPANLKANKATPVLTRIKPDGSVVSYTGGGLDIPWGITTDGSGHVWVADFGGRRISRFCGATAASCPRGLKQGAAISGDKGYGFNGFQRLTGVHVDASGIVWVANNWKNIPVQTNPAGDGMVALIGAATPVVPVTQN
ncbi:MAG: hypothetical protein RL441_1586 [Actinomycetota bacterium]|jgi:sugar lactone lactonase YvrE